MLSKVLLKEVLVELAALHDHHEILRRVFDQIDVNDGVAIDEQQIGKRAFLNNPELAGIGGARPG
jgi:hypothetical protein